MTDRRERLQSAVLYLICDDQPADFLEAALRGGVDIVQLRMKHGSDQAVLSAASRFRAACRRQGALFILNDRPDLALAADADGVHVGQDDVPIAEARATVGAERLVGLSTHSPAQIDAAEADYIGVGPVYATPTKPGRPAVGLELVRYAARHAAMPFFAIGGIGAAEVPAVRAAGARRIALVRALTGSADPQRTARALRERLVQVEAQVAAP
jgi:thiamine-phosphate pyrophosphorylase